MIRLAVRLAVAGGRASTVRFLVTVVGAAIGVAVLLLAVGLEPAMVARGQRLAQRVPVPHEYDVATVAGDQPIPDSDVLLLVTTTHRIDGSDVTVIDAASTGLGSPRPPGLAAAPTSEQVFASPNLIKRPQLLSALSDGRRLAGSISERGLADANELVLWRGWEAVELLASARELAAVEAFPVPPPARAWWSSEPARLVGVAGAAAVLLVPVGVFIGVMVRLGALQRQRRMASLALLGATTSQLQVLAGVEGGLVGALAVGLGTLFASAARPAVAAIPIGGHAWFPTDLQPRPVMAIALAIAVIATASVAGPLAARSIARAPLEITSRADEPPVSVWRLAAPLAGLTLVAMAAWFADGLSPWTVAGLTGSGAGFVVIGIPVAAPWLLRSVSAHIGHRSRVASLLVAARRIQDDPYAAVRASSGVLLAVFSISVVLGYTTGNLGEEADIPFPNGVDAVIEPYGANPERVQRFLDAIGRIDGLENIAVVQRLQTDDGHPVLIAECEDINSTGIAVLEPCPAVGWSHPDVDGDNVESLIQTEIARGDSAKSAIGWLRPPATATGVHLGADVVIDRSRVSEHVAAGAETSLIAIDGEAEAIQLAASTILPGHEVTTRETRELSWNAPLRDLQRVIGLLCGLILLVGLASLITSLLGGWLTQRETLRHLRRAGVTSRDLLAASLWQAALPLTLTVPIAATAGVVVSAGFTHAVGGRFEPPLMALLGLSLASVVMTLVPVMAFFPVVEYASRPDAPNSE